MSYELTDLALRCDLKTNLKIVYSTLARHANEKSYCQKTHTWRAWPSIERIAKYTGLSQSSVRRALKGLAQCGLIKIIARRLKQYRNLSNVYILNRPTAEQLLDVETKAEEVSPVESSVETVKEEPVTLTPTPRGEGVTEKIQGVTVTPEQITITNNNSLLDQSFEPKLPPDSVDSKAWADYTDLLKRLKKPFPDAEQHSEQGKFLAQFDAKTQRAIVIQSVRNGWQSLHPVSNKIYAFKSKSFNTRSSSVHRRDRSIRERLEDRSWANGFTPQSYHRVNREIPLWEQSTHTNWATNSTKP